MVDILFLAVVLLGVLLFDTRERLKRLEAQSRARDGAVGGEARPSGAMVRGPAVIVDRQAPVPPGSDEDVPAEVIAQADAVQVAEYSPVDPAHREAPATQAAMPDPIPAEIPSQTPGLVPAPAAAQASVPPVPPRREAPVPPKPPRGSGQRFEDLFGRQLPIWAGGITLAVAGVLLVKYSIDAGLLSPVVRVLLGLLFGGGLIAGAEVALRAEDRVGDPRVRQALSGAGIATLYAAILAASDLYALIGPATAFVGLAAVTALAMALSIRFGAPSAILGLVGGLAAPALVGEGPPNVPLLSAYLALAIGGLTALSRRQRWMWLGVAALAGGAGWGGVLILTGALDVATSLSLGTLLLLLGVILPGVAFTGLRAGAMRIGAAVVAAAQVALLVAKGGFAPLEWGFYMLLAAALGWLAWREARFRPLPPVALTVGLLLLALWPVPPMGQFAMVLLALAAIHAVPALLRLWRADGTMADAGKIAAVALGGYAVTLFHYASPGRENGLALLALGCAVLPALAALSGWRRAERQGDACFAVLVLASSVLMAAAGVVGLASWLWPVAFAILGAGLALLARSADDRRLEHGAVAFLAGSVVALLSVPEPLHEIDRLIGEASDAAVGQAILRWGAVALAMGIGAVRLTIRGRAPVAGIAAVTAYGAVAQFAPAWSLPVVAGVGLVAMAEARQRRADAPAEAAAVGFAGIALLWAAWPFALWAGQALSSLTGEPMLVAGLPTVLDAVTRLGVPAGAGVLLLMRGGAMQGRWRAILWLVPGMLGSAALHSLYKHGFALGNADDVVRLGLAERTLWEALLLGTGVALWRLRSWPRAALVGAGAAVAHGLWYSQLLLNPLWREVAVGPWPVVNLLLPAFATLFAGLWVVERLAVAPGGAVWRSVTGRGIAIVRMMLVVLFAYASLRQLFAGSLLVGTPIGPVENIGWSVLAIGLAIGFLLWGIRSGRHDWRIGSLLLMLAAVAKVFLMDAAGLEGLLRIISFLALGFSLIGIGWLYSRFLRRGEEAPEGQA